MRLRGCAIGGACVMLGLPVARAADEPPASLEVGQPYESVVTATTPLHGSGLPRDRVAANVQTVRGEALADSHSLDLSSYMIERLGSVHVNDVAGNPLQPDLQYRGFVASPLLGASEGLSVYLNGVRLNEPFGDTVNWDLLPTNAIRSMNLMPGSNPIFGLNTLGGALSIETKTGFSDAGVAAHLSGGSFARRDFAFEVGGHGRNFAGFAAGHTFAETGWRPFSPSRTASGFLSTTYADGPTFVDLSLSGAATTLTGNGATPEQLLAIDRNAIFTHPDRTENHLLMALLRGERGLGAKIRLSGTLAYRQSRTATTNGDQREWARCTTAGQMGNVCSVDTAGVETVVTDRGGTPVPFDAGMPFDAANNGTSTHQRGVGGTVQLAVDAALANRENHLVIGTSADEGWVTFSSQSTLARLTATRGTDDSGIIDPDSRVAVDTVVRSLGAYATDTFAARSDLFVTAAGRFNLSSLALEDQIGDALTGKHTFHRLNPSLGVSYQPRTAFGVYGSYSESARTPTPIELTCASPTDPCRLPNAFVADPPLEQVVARTIELGARGRWTATGTTLDYTAATFRTTSANDILFISSGMVANQGYFTNVGQTRRQGVETSLRGRHRLTPGGSRVEWSANYTLLHATFMTPFTALSATHPAAVNGSLAVPAGARIPGIPAQVAKVAVTWESAFGLAVGGTVVANSSQYYRGDEANLLAPLAGYVVVNLLLSYRISRPLSVTLRVNNVLDTAYSTFGVLGDATDVLGPIFDSPRFQGRGAPRAAWLTFDLRY
jgi:iron complex outermembrane receptor protein